MTHVVPSVYGKAYSAVARESGASIFSRIPALLHSVRSFVLSRWMLRGVSFCLR